MQAVILAAGKGTRLKPLTASIPKSLIEVNGTPIIEQTLKALPNNVHEIFIVVGYLKEKIQEYLGDEWNGKKIHYVEQEDLDGTGSALHLVKSRLKDKFIVVNGDDIYNESDLERLSTHPLGILVKETSENIKGFLLENEQHHMEAIEGNAPDSEIKLQVCGAYILDERFFRYKLAEITTHAKTEFSLPHTLVSMAKDCDIVVERATWWYPIGTYKQLREVHKK